MRGSTKNFGALMARAADYVVAEARKIVEVGELDPELVTLPGFLWTQSSNRRMSMDAKNFIAARVAKELKDGDVVNLGIVCRLSWQITY